MAMLDCSFSTPPAASLPFSSHWTLHLRSPSLCFCRTSSHRRLHLPNALMAAFSRLCVGSRALPRTRWGLGPSRGARVLPPTAVRAMWKQEVLWTEASISEVAPAGEQLFHLVVDISGSQQLMHGHTKAGQFLQMKVGESQPSFMAIASPPTAAVKGYLEFLVKDIEGTTAGALCDLYKGDRVELSQILGKGFDVDQIYPVEQFQTVLLFATGTGISPIRSLIELGIHAKDRKDVRLYYGARNLHRMAYQEKFKEWEASGIRVIPVLSQPADKWNGEKGYVQAAFSKLKALTASAQIAAILCGQKAMAEELTALLLAEGVCKEKILLNF